MVAMLAYHDAQGENPHAHVMLSTREISAAGWGKKRREWNAPEMLREWRRGWERCANHALEQAGSRERIDCRSLDAQGVERPATVHLGPWGGGAERRAHNAEAQAWARDQAARLAPPEQRAAAETAQRAALALTEQQQAVKAAEQRVARIAHQQQEQQAAAERRQNRALEAQRRRMTGGGSTGCGRGWAGWASAEARALCGGAGGQRGAGRRSDTRARRGMGSSGAARQAVERERAQAVAEQWQAQQDYDRAHESDEQRQARRDAAEQREAERQTRLAAAHAAAAQRAPQPYRRPTLAQRVEEQQQQPPQPALRRNRGPSRSRRGPRRFSLRVSARRECGGGATADPWRLPAIPLLPASMHPLRR